MKILILIVFMLGLAQTAFGVSNRVIQGLDELKALGFEFVIQSEESNGVISMRITLPNQFNTGEDTGTKPFSAVAFIRTGEDVEPDAGLIGAPASRFPLNTTATKNGSHQCSFTILATTSKNGYLEVSYIRSSSGDWPMLIHIPIASLIEQNNKQNKSEMATPRKPSD